LAASLRERVGALILRGTRLESGSPLASYFGSEIGSTVPQVVTIENVLRKTILEHIFCSANTIQGGQLLRSVATLLLLLNHWIDGF
jgi:hypothetical protein